MDGEEKLVEIRESCVASLVGRILICLIGTRVEKSTFPKSQSPVLLLQRGGSQRLS